MKVVVGLISAMVISVLVMHPKDNVAATEFDSYVSQNYYVDTKNLTKEERKQVLIDYKCERTYKFLITDVHSQLEKMSFQEVKQQTKKYADAGYEREKLIANNLDKWERIFYGVGGDLNSKDVVRLVWFETCKDGRYDDLLTEMYGEDYEN